MRLNITRAIVNLVASVTLSVFVLPAVAENGYEIPAVLKASDWVTGKKLDSPLYKIDPMVPTDGLLMTFTVRSDFGSFELHSLERLDNCLTEISAMDQLDRISESDVFIDGFKRSAKELKQQAENLVTKPVQTLEGIPTGVGRFFKRTYRAAKTSTQRLGDITQSSEIESSQIGPGAKLPGGVAQQKDSTDVITTGAAMVGNTAVNILGYGEQRRELARELNVDPYTTNRVLAKKLDHVAWVAFTGGLGISALKMAAPASMAISMSTKASGWVYNTPPGDLKVFNEKTLLAIGVDQQSVDSFLRHRWYTLTLQSRLVRALDRIKGAKQRPSVMNLALSVESEAQARFVTEALEMIAHYHEQSKPIIAIEVRESVIGRTEGRGIVIPAPLDYVSWTKHLHHFITQDDLKAKQRIILLRGRLTTLAREALERLQWKVQQHFSD